MAVARRALREREARRRRISRKPESPRVSGARSVPPRRRNLMSDSVRAFQPRQYDPPRFVAEDIDELEEKEGEYVGAGQCDGCGNSTYLIQVRMIAPGTRQFEAVCAVDPTDDPEFVHPAPCGATYPITIYDSDLVEF